MSKVIVNESEQIAENEVIFTIKSASDEFIDLVDNLDSAKDIANANPGSSVYDETGSIVYPVNEPEEETMVKEVDKSKPKKKVVAPAPVTENCVQVSTQEIHQVAKESSKKETVKPQVNKIIMPGKMVRLNKQPIFKSAYIPQPFKLYEGNVFIFDGVLTNGRYRITDTLSKCGSDVKNIIGYIPESYIK